MGFEARVFIQGTGNYVAHDDRNRLLVLFPSSERAAESRLRDVSGNPVCRHYSVLQFSSTYLDPSWPEVWMTIDVTGHWVGFDSTCQRQLELPADDVPGLPTMDRILAEDELGEYAGLDHGVLPGGGAGDGRLQAGFFADRGVLSPDNAYQGRFTVVGREDRELQTADFANVLKLELGEVESFEIRLRPFDGPEAPRIALRAPGDELDVWVRHFCDLRKPHPRLAVPEAAEPDLDFALNYALLDKLPALIESRGNRLPVPQVWKSWSDGGPIGGDARMCVGSFAGFATFDSPFA